MEEQRKKIDELDQKIVALLEQRMEAVSEIARLKKAAKLNVLDTSREAVVLEKVGSYVKKPEYKKPIQESYQALMDISKNYQKQHIDS